MSTSSLNTETLKAAFLKALEDEQTDEIRDMLASHKKELTSEWRFKNPRGTSWPYPVEIERDAFTLLGAYQGPMTALQLAILLGKDSIARDILDSTFEQDIDLTFGSGNTALHLAVVLGASSIVPALVERGAAIDLKNSKGYSSVDMSDDKEILSLLESPSEE
ncbi:hypothetical protein BGZ73_003449 [Actinomortierella ambigua]|nr:hypothetical protein BGZ73_003449 [Actinomortierella ambigua]